MSALAQPSINSVTKTESRCSKTGTATISVTGGTGTLQYSFISPSKETRPNQSSNAFLALAPGSYTVRVVDGSGGADTSTFTIAGNYSIPTYTTTVRAAFCSKSNGFFRLNTSSGGRGPFSYKISSGPTTTGWQSSNSFSNVPKGTYQVTVSDSCGNTKNISVTVSDSAFNPLYINRGTIQASATQCDSFTTTFNAYYGIAPYKYRVIMGTDTIKFSQNTTLTLKKGPNYKYEVVDDCGVQKVLSLVENRSLIARSVFECNGFKVTVSPYYYGAFYQSTCMKYGALNKSTNVAVWQRSNAFILDSNVTYDLFAIDTCCNDTFKVTSNFTINSSFTVFKKYITNLDSTTGVYFYNYSTRTPYHAILLQSPFSASDSFTTTPDQDFQGKLKYNYKAGDTIGFYTSSNFLILNMPKGTYSFLVRDTCGLEDTVTFEVLESDLWKRDIEGGYIAGCPSGHSLTYNIRNTSNYKSSFLVKQISPSLGTINLYSKIPNGTYKDTILSQNAGTYVFEIGNAWGGTYFTGSGASYIRDTVVVQNPGYPILDFPTTYSCKNGTSSIVAGANGGVKPYRFRIKRNTDTVWSALQSSNEFHGLSTGVYNIEVVDSCGNTNVISSSSGYLTAPSVNLGFECEADTLTIFGNPIYGVNYRWYKGTTVISTDLAHSFKPYKVSDYGTYKLQAYLSNTNGVCVDTSATITIGSSIEVRNPDEIACDSFQFKGKWYHETGFYKDTVQSTGGCDSIAAVKVYVGQKSFVSLDSTSCDSSLLFNTWYYNSQTVTKNFPGIGAVLDTLVFSGFETNPSGWTLNNVIISTGDAQSGNKKLSMNSTNDWFVLPKVDFPDQLNFDYKLSSLDKGSNKVTVQYDSSGTWVNLEELEQSSSIYERQIVDLSSLSDSAQVQIRVRQTSQSGGTQTYFDNVHITDLKVECDTTISIKLKINKSKLVNPKVTECDSAQLFGEWYYASQLVKDTLKTFEGCDSFVHTDLVIHNTKTTRQNVTACDSALIHGKVYDASVNILDTLKSHTGCDSLVYTNLIVNYTQRKYDSIAECDSAVVQGRTYYSSQVVKDTFQSYLNCDSIIITDLTIQFTKRTYADATVCDSVQIHSNWYFTSQMVNDTFSSHENCDSIVITDLTVNYSEVTPVDLTVCDSGRVHGKMYHVSQLIKDSFQTWRGCDSVVWTNLVVNYTQRNYNQAIVCDSTQINGNSYYASQEVQDTFTSYLNCDSILITDLTVNYTKRTYEDVTVCDSAEIHSNWYYASQVVNDTFSSIENCDSIVITNLMVHYTQITPVDLTVCDSGVVHGTTYYVSQLIKDSFQTWYGCDSVVWTNLIVHYTQRTYEQRVVCDSTVIHGNSYYSSQLVQDTFTSYLNCDSIVLTDLTVNYTVREFKDSTQCDSALIHGNWYHSSQVVRDTFVSYLNCDSIVITNLRINRTKITEQNASACDSMQINDNWYFSSQLVTDHLMSAQNCDSIVYTDLVIRHSFKRIYDDTFCMHYSYELDDGRMVEEPGVYQSIYSNVSDCDSIIEVNLIAKDCSPCTIMFPSAFTPNIDGKNEVFKREGTCAFEKYQLTIFNRWGERLFYTENPEEAWDGTFHGKLVPMGVYFYSCYYINVEEKVENMVGDVAVLQ